MRGGTMTTWFWRTAFVLVVLADLLTALLIFWLVTTKRSAGLYILDRPISMSLPRLFIMLVLFLAAAAAIWEVKIR